MRSSRLLTSLLLASTALAQSEAQSFRLPGKSVALLIGTDTYNATNEWARLSSPVLDASTIAKTLAADFSYDTTVVRNATKSEVIRRIVEHGKSASSNDDWSFIFIAAHGYFDEERSQGYLVFRDSRPRQDDVARSTYLSLTELRGIVEGFRAGHVMLVIDACYAGTIDPDIRFGTDRAARAGRPEVEESLLRRAQYRSRMYLTSGGKEYVPDGRPGAHSPFAAALLGALRQASNEGAALTFNQILGHMAAAAVQPLPRHNNFRGHEPGGDFLLVPKSFAGAVASGNAAARLERASEVPRGGDRRESSGNPEPSRAAASRALLFVGVDYSDAQARAAESGQVLELVRGKIAQAFKDQGVQAAAGADAAALSAEDKKRCDSGMCVDVTANVARTVSAGRQTITVTLNARSRSTSRLLGSATARDGPRLLDVPSDRMVERAVDKALAEFVGSVLATLGR